MTMADLYYDATGALLQLVRAGGLPPPAPPKGATLLQFDEQANPGLVDDLNANWNQYSAAAGALTKSGAKVPVNAGTPPPVMVAALPPAPGVIQALVAKAAAELASQPVPPWAVSTIQQAAAAQTAAIQAAPAPV
jgi:hypothetical protein